MKNKNNGITLIALIITIIVLLLLAGISINMLSGQDGILSKASDAKSAWEQTTEEDMVNLENIERQFEAYKLPDDDSNPDLKTFITVWRVNAGEEIILPLCEFAKNDFNGFFKEDIEDELLRYDFTVDYGDGTVSEVTSYNDVDAKHTYTQAGDYEVKISGLCEGFSFFQQHGSKAGADANSKKLVGLKQWGVIGVKEISFDCCSNLTSQLPVPSKNTFVNAKYINYLFRGCKLTGTIPENFFANMPEAIVICNTFSGQRGLTGNIPVIHNMSKLKTVQSIFYDCENLTGAIPNDFLEGCNNIEIVHGLFSGCSNITGSIPQNFLKDCTKATTVRQLFTGCAGLNGEIPNTIFANCKEITDFRMTFAECTGLTGNIPGNLFTNCPKAENFLGVFADCAGLTGNIPENLFANCKETTDFTLIFSGCTGLTGNIPENLFANCIKATNFVATFAGCTGLTGNIPENLFANNTKAVDFQYLLEFCTGLTGEIPVELFANCTDAENFGSTFSGCVGLTKIPTDIFKNNKKIKSLKATFSNIDEDGDSLAENIDQNTQMGFEGTAPELWNIGVSTENGANCFQGCTKLDNYDDIPAEWK